MNQHSSSSNGQPGGPRRPGPVVRARVAGTRLPPPPAPSGPPPRRTTGSRRPPPTVTPEELGTMLAVGGRPGEDERLDRGLVRAAMDRPYAVRVLVRVQDLRTRPYSWWADPFTIVGAVLALAWAVRILLVL